MGGGLFLFFITKIINNVCKHVMHYLLTDTESMFFIWCYKLLIKMIYTAMTNFNRESKSVLVEGFLIYENDTFYIISEDLEYKWKVYEKSIKPKIDIYLKSINHIKFGEVKYLSENCYYKFMYQKGDNVLIEIPIDLQNRWYNKRFFNCL